MSQPVHCSNGWDRKAGPSAEGWLEETQATFGRSQEAERGSREQTYQQGTNTTHQVANHALCNVDQSLNPA